MLTKWIVKSENILCVYGGGVEIGGQEMTSIINQIFPQKACKIGMYYTIM